MGNNQNGTAWEDVGCIILIGLIALPFILQSLFAALMPYLMVGGIGLGIYRLYIYHTRTGLITGWLEEYVGLKASKDQETEGEKGLPKPQEDLLRQMQDLQDKVNQVQQENEQLKMTRKKDIQDTLHAYAEKIDRENKKELLNDLFQEHPNEYDQSEEFEKRKYQDQVKKQKEELEIENLKLDLDKHLFEQDQAIYEVKKEAEEDRHHIRLEMHDGFSKVDDKFLHLEKDIATFKGFVIEKFARVETQFAKEIGHVKDLVSNLRVEVKQELADTKVMFGKEIVRLDKQQLKIVGQLQDYEAKVRAFATEVEKAKLHAEKVAMRGEEMLNRANTIYQSHKAEMTVLSSNLSTGLQQMALYKSDFALSVGKAKLKMDELSNDHYVALKSIAMEKAGVNMLRQDFQQRYENQQLKMQKLVDEKRQLNEKINENLSRGREVEGLRHQLYMTQENLRYADNRANLMRQEYSLLSKLSK